MHDLDHHAYRGNVFSVLAAASGDGIIHELLNGLASRPDAIEALKIPMVPIPTGSANGMSINLLGLEDGFDIALACLNAIKGEEMSLDICSAATPEKRRFSFMSVAMGLMAEVDLGTEHLRWLGDTRFVYGFVKGLVYNSAMKARLYLKVDTADKGLMVQRLNDCRHQKRNRKLSQVPKPIEDDETLQEIPPPRILEPDSTWVTIESGTRYRQPKSHQGRGSSPGSSSSDAPLNPKGSWTEGDGIIYI